MTEIPTETLNSPSQATLNKDELVSEVLLDYRTGWESRHASLLGRKEVLTGKAKFGIFGDGKELPQLAMAKAFRAGDIRSGYYRDQTFMLATGMMSLEGFFAQLYAHCSLEHEPASGGRSMNGHFATRWLNKQGQLLNLTDQPQSTADISPTGGQMGRGLGIAYASKLYRSLPDLHEAVAYSRNGNEISYVTIGNASTSEGHFWEVINAGGVLQVPLLVSVWDDGYGISVPAAYQTTKENIGTLLQGFRTGPDGQGYRMYTCPGWDYPRLCALYLKAADLCRQDHMPVLFHVTELTQPQGHSTSGSHERYKSPERLQWEKEYDGLNRMRAWILAQGFADESALDRIEAEAATRAKEAQTKAYLAFRGDLDAWTTDTLQSLDDWSSALKAQIASPANPTCENPATENSSNGNPASINHTQSALQAVSAIDEAIAILRSEREPLRRDLMQALRRSIWSAHRLGIAGWSSEAVKVCYRQIIGLRSRLESLHHLLYNRDLHSHSAEAVEHVQPVAAQYSDEAESLNGFEILNLCFEYWLREDPRFVALGEDVGRIGDVNQGFARLQEKFGDLRVSDTGIREMSIVGQGLGAAMRGLRPLVEIQYLDYLLYAIQILSDDVATLQYRTAGGQKAPLIVRTRGHRLEGIWHSGSPMGMILNALRGMHVLVPRNMVQAVGFYNTLMKSDEPALVIECLNGYRLKEKLPSNLHEIRVVPGQVEILRRGEDLTLVTYGSCCRIAMEAAGLLEALGISVELIDAQSLLPFDHAGVCANSLRKTSRLLVLDEDVPGGASAYLLQQILERQSGFALLDWAPQTLTAQAHRPAYGSDGDYFSKPSVDDVVEAVWSLMSNAEPGYYAPLPKI
jgi:pyruvate/2-oxoglutarate/acetoin dehydrogenase E1 component/TPP-dependent pyruvate/acetoin dehydrogenase alpha subunit